MKNFYRLFLEIIAVVIFSSAVSAATFTVNSLADGDDGICDVVSCTLREAINAANAAGGADTINFSVSGTINVGATLLTASKFFNRSATPSAVRRQLLWAALPATSFPATTKTA